MSASPQPATSGNSRESIGRRESVDTGMAFTLIFLLFAVFSAKTMAFVLAALLMLLVTMSFPALLKPLAILWFGFSNNLGGVMSTILLSVIYFIVIFPIGWCRQKMGKDSMSLNTFDQNHISFFKDRDHEFNKDDLLTPY